MEEEIGRVECELDGRFSYIRTQVSRVGFCASVPENIPATSVFFKHSITGNQSRELGGGCDEECDQGRLRSPQLRNAEIRHSARGWCVQDEGINCCLKCSHTFVVFVQLFTLLSLNVQDLMAILPMADPLVVLELTGEQLLAALENGVSQYPKQEGRFPQVSGLSFSFNPQQPSRSRVLSNTVCVNGKPLETDKVCVSV